MPKMKHLYYYKVKEIIKIVDGDTVDLGIDLGFDLTVKIRVRMSGINAWESRTRNKEEKKKGLAAKVRLTEMCEESLGKGTLKISTKEKGKYGRYLGVLYAGGKSINDAMVNEGHAHYYDGGKRKKFG
jgi:endonuclease YncB( thermonuclease family)